jgi:hypothetical protein
LVNLGMFDLHGLGNSSTVLCTGERLFDGAKLVFGDWVNRVFDQAKQIKRAIHSEIVVQ